MADGLTFPLCVEYGNRLRPVLSQIRSLLLFDGAHGTLNPAKSGCNLFPVRGFTPPARTPASRYHYWQVACLPKSQGGDRDNVIHKRADHPSERITFPRPSNNQSQLQHYNKNKSPYLLQILFLRRLSDLLAGPDVVSCLAAVATVAFCLAAVSARTTPCPQFLLKLPLNSLAVYNILSILYTK